MPETGKRVGELLSYLETTRAALLSTVSSISPGLAAVRPRSDQWSVNEIVAHLALVDTGIARLIGKTIDQARGERAAGGGEDESVVNSLDRYRVTEVIVKVSAPASIVPENATSLPESLASLERSRATLCASLVESADMNLERYMQPHPMLKSLNVYQWALFDGQHEERHRRQIERTIDEVTERAVECAPVV